MLCVWMSCFFKHCIVIVVPVIVVIVMFVCTAHGTHLTFRLCAYQVSNLYVKKGKNTSEGLVFVLFRVVVVVLILILIVVLIVVLIVILAGFAS